MRVRIVIIAEVNDAAGTVSEEDCVEAAKSALEDALDRAEGKGWHGDQPWLIQGMKIMEQVVF